MLPYAKFLTLIFKRERVNLANCSRTNIESSEDLNVATCQNLNIPTDFVRNLIQGEGISGAQVEG